MIVIIRIKGIVGLKSEIAETLKRLRLRKKYSCVVLPENQKNMGMIKKVKDYVAYGQISDEIFEKLIEKRGQILNKNQNNKINPKDIVKEIKEGKKYQELNLKPYFRLHPARGGIDTKRQFSEKKDAKKGVLGNHGEKINELVERML